MTFGEALILSNIWIACTLVITNCSTSDKRFLISPITAAFAVFYMLVAGFKLYREIY